MGDVSVLEPSDEVEFDVITTEVVEQLSTFPEEDRNQGEVSATRPGPRRGPRTPSSTCGRARSRSWHWRH
ncbi:hypothetical protein EBESD8_25540 [Rhodococcus aetherivorans]|nr:hypothetical protein EBESD8_25540 [Rhodococcus aetherivorans]